MFFRDLDLELDNLAKALVIFNNKNQVSPAFVKYIFGNLLLTEEDFEPPDEATCLAVQSEVKTWLSDLDAGYESARYVMAGGLPFEGGPPGTSIPSKGIRISARPMVQQSFDTAKNFGDELQVSWEVEETDLRSVCALGVVYMYLEVRDRVGFCEIEDCDNIFIGRRSHGKKRKFCGSKRCEAILNKRRIARYRAAKAKKARSTKDGQTT